MQLAALARACREETSKFVAGRPRDDAYCFELFERAIVQRDQGAWDAILSQYAGMVVAYVRQHPSEPVVREDHDYWVNRAFQRFWMALTPEKFSRFPDVSSLLKYLKLCVHSVIFDELRARRSAQLTPLDEVPPTAAPAIDAEAQVLDELAGRELWATVARALPEESERLVAYLSLAHDQKPREIYERHRERYASVADVYRIKHNVLQRLRRSPELRALLA